jgi:hypothetical protein
MIHDGIIHRIADKVFSRKPLFTRSDAYALGPVLRAKLLPDGRGRQYNMKQIGWICGDRQGWVV